MEGADGADGADGPRRRASAAAPARPASAAAAGTPASSDDQAPSCRVPPLASAAGGLITKLPGPLQFPPATARRFGENPFIRRDRPPCLRQYLKVGAVGGVRGACPCFVLPPAFDAFGVGLPPRQWG